MPKGVTMKEYQFIDKDGNLYIPQDFLRLKQLSADEKLFYAEVKSGKKLNIELFAKIFNVTEATIKEWIKHLESEGFTF